MFATTILACDMGGYPLAQSLAGGDVNAANFAGLLLGSMMGATIVFSIPVGLGIIPVEDRKFLGQGILVGLITIPIGCVVGGAVAGYPFVWMVQNLIPVIIFAVIIALGLAFVQPVMIKIFLWFGRIVVAFLTVSLIIAVVQTVLGGLFGKAGDNDMWGFIVPGMDPLWSAYNTVGTIAATLAGAFGLVFLLTKFLGGPLEKLGKALGMNKSAAAGLVATLANNIAMFNIMKDMDDRGKVINTAFAVSAAFVFGDHLGYVGGVEPSMIAPVIVGKLVAGITAVIVATFVAPKAAAVKA
jgi:ethanolamine transporter